MKKLVKRILGGLAALLVVAQFIPVTRDNPPETAPMALPGGEVGEVLKAACLDCHSHATVWPWYARVAPAKFLVARHVTEGREHFNLSTWGEQELSRRDHKLEEVVEVVESGEMPEGSYTWLHPEARLTDAQRQALIEWAKAERAALQPPAAVPAPDSLGTGAVAGDSAAVGGGDAGAAPPPAQ